MMVTNIASNPTDTITLRANDWTSITTIKNNPGTEYFVSAYLRVSGGSITVSFNGDGTISSNQRVSYRMTASNDFPMSMMYKVVSGSPTVTVTNMLICTSAEYWANKTMLDSIGYFTGDTMPLG
ncbi:hypothetical protein [Bifidobacterium longum]|uniref:CBM-cenC domain-containing protein n=1 Tax=Bifidobacterium longum subsp. suis TaxID=1695 RepID=A0A087BFF4_BIFLN|nr:hypothetical protein [Bifidobacterium longum]KFI69754.1 hypothetical protein BLSS_0055 [Bifidobacterium longum subsp. suis]UNU71440.1 hypothetical protein LMY38_01980 [Bifidobacterium longum]SDO57861.1 hypothetical protein SAMN04489749_1501 [Bifidobacterium longum]